MIRLLASLLAFLVLSAASAQEVVFPAGSRIGLVPPKGMALARGLSGFRNAGTGTGIVFVEMPVDAYPQLAATLSDQALRAQGFRLRKREDVTLPTGKALLVSGEQQDGSRLVPKVLLLAPDPSFTALVMGQLRDDAPSAEIEAVETALRTVALRPPLSLDEQVQALPFAIPDRAGFRIVRAIAGTSVLMTDGVNDVVRDAEQPVLIVAQSFAPGPPPGPQREPFARQALLANTFLQEAVIERSQSFRQGGAEWHEIVAKAKDAAGGTPVIVMQTIRFEPDGYLRSVGVVRPDKRDAVLPRFRRIVDSLVVK